MNHLEHETLWGLAKHELSTSDVQDAEQHLSGCAECRVALDDVKLAVGALFDLPPVPTMPEAMARRVHVALAEAVDEKAARSFTSWWQDLFSPRFALAFAMGVVLVAGAAWLLSQETQSSVTPTPGLAQQQPEVSPTPAPTTPAKPKLQVKVSSAKKATAQKKQVLNEGSVVATQTGGSLWMELPDGSRAGLTSASEVKLAKLERDTLSLDLDKGSLALVVPHREDRVLTVKAGDLVVKDLGTRFLVAREPTHTVVAVEEGVVEVQTPTGTQQVKAGHAVTWREGKLSQLEWEATPPPQPKAVRKVEANEGQVTSVARLDEEEDDDEGTPPIDENPTSPPPETTAVTATNAPPDTHPVETDEDWAELPEGTTTPPPVVKADAAVVGKVKKTKKRGPGFSLKNLERKLREFGTVITSPSSREARAKNIMLAADAGDCEFALQLADEWMKEPVTKLATEASMHRGVQLQQVRCLNHLGRKDEATALQKSIDGAK